MTYVAMRQVEHAKLMMTSMWEGLAPRRVDLRIRRPVALLQTLSPRCRHEPRALASYLDT
jgi:hypothetical protein